MLSAAAIQHFNFKTYIQCGLWPVLL